MLIKALSAKTQRAFAPNASSVCPVCIMHPAQMDDAFCKSVTSTVNSKITITMKATPNKGMKLSAEDVRACLQHRLHRSLNYRFYLVLCSRYTFQSRLNGVERCRLTPATVLGYFKEEGEELGVGSKLVSSDGKIRI